MWITSPKVESIKVYRFAAYKQVNEMNEWWWWLLLFCVQTFVFAFQKSFETEPKQN